ncbi:MAG TPA: hypothetical protein VFN22_13740 [Gemmatimonadales bacterium]|nr:hypothetical protein [Gemmatimonadales bacterium]
MKALLAACAIGVAISGVRASLPAQALPTGRWAVRVHGEMLEDRGDLRLDADRGGLLLESRDSAWLPVDQVEWQGPSLRFRISGGGLFVGTLAGDSLTGLWHGPATTPARFEARRIPPGSDEWPVGPRIRFRELVVGSDATSSQFPDAWRARLMPRETLLAEHARLAAAVGMPPAGVVGIVQRAQALVVGERPEGRRLAAEMLDRIAAGPAADADFRRIFGRPGAWRLDMHQVAWELAEGRVGPAHVRPERLAAALQATAVLPAGDIDSVQVRRTLWELARRRYYLTGGGNGAGTFETDARLIGARAIVDAYVDARRWWLEAVTWLLERAWVETPDGYRSPRAMVAAFWGTDSLVTPPTVPTSFGAMQAVPVVGLGALVPQLVEPANAVAAEWLATGDGLGEAFETWRRIETRGVPSLPVVAGSTSMMLRDPGEVVRSRLGGFVGATDRILIDPTILPLFAVGTVVHEWQHLLFSSARLGDPAARAWRRHPWGIHLLDGDPWLAEGAAEWATEQVFAPAATTMPLFQFIEAEKRLALGAERPDDTHVLGYLLVRALADRVMGPRQVRTLLVRHLAEPLVLADAIGLGGPVSIGMVRPNTLMIIPELTFVPDGGVSRELSRRLLVPDFREELD